MSLHYVLGQHQPADIHTDHAMPPPSLLSNPSNPTVFSFSSSSITFPSPPNLSPLCCPRHCYSTYFVFRAKLHSFSTTSLSSSPYVSHFHTAQPFEEEEPVIGDCIVFEDGIFEDPFLEEGLNGPMSSNSVISPKPQNKKKSKKKSETLGIEPQNLVPEQWQQVVEEISINKKERRKLARDLEFGQRIDKKKRELLPIGSVTLEDYLKFKREKLSQLNPVILDSPSDFPAEDKESSEEEEADGSEGFGEYEDIRREIKRVEPKNPRWAVYGRTLDDISEFFNSEDYKPGDRNSEGRVKLFTKEEKQLMNSKVPNLAIATSRKWLPLHTLAACGEFYLVNNLLKHDVDVDAADQDGRTALHKAILGKKQAITNYLLRESANPFVCDKDGATLMHYAVQTASSHAIKTLLMYNVDINSQDKDGWTPLHVAVHARRTDVVRLLLIKGADKTLKNKDGLSSLGLCLHLGRDRRTYELIKLLKLLPKPGKRQYY